MSFAWIPVIFALGMTAAFLIVALGSKSNRRNKK